MATAKKKNIIFAINNRYSVGNKQVWSFTAHGPNVGVNSLSDPRLFPADICFHLAASSLFVLSTFYG